MKNNCRLQQLQLGPTPDRNYKCSINHHQNRRKNQINHKSWKQMLRIDKVFNPNVFQFL